MRRSVVMLGLVATALLGGCSPSAPASPQSPRPASPATSPPPSVAPSEPLGPSAEPSPASVPLADRLEAEIEVRGSPDWPAAGFGSIWVLAPDLPATTGSGTPNLIRIDPATNEVVATIPLPDRLCQGFVVTDDAIWACSADAMVRIDPERNEIVESVPVKAGQAFYQPAFGGSMVWALASTSFVADTVVKLEPATGRTTSYPQSGSVGGLSYAFDALWLTITGEGTLLRLDPASGETTVVTSGLAAPTGIVAGAESLWVSLHGAEGGEAEAGETQLVRIDPSSGEIVAEFVIGGSPKGGVIAWADADGVLVRSTTPWLAVIDPESNQVVETITADVPVQGPLTVAHDSIWTIAIERDVVYRLSR